MNAPLLTHFVEHCEVVAAPNGEPINSSHREPWLEARRSLITASDVAALMGLDPRRDALSVFLSKKRPPEKETLTWEDPRFWGLELEQAIGRIVAKYCGWQFHAGGYLLRSKRWPWLGATLDAEVLPANETDWRPYEGKNVSTWLANDWQLEQQMPPDRVLIQTTVQLMVTGARMAHAFALIGGSKPAPIEVPIYEDLFQRVLEVTEEFQDRLQRDDPYPATYKSTEAIAKAYPEDNGQIIKIEDHRVSELVEQCSRKSIEATELGEEVEGMRNQLKMVMGEAAYGELMHPAEIEVRHTGRRLPRTIHYLKCGVEPRSAHYVEESFPRILRFVKDLPKELQLPKTATRRRRR